MAPPTQEAAGTGGRPTLARAPTQGAARDSQEIFVVPRPQHRARGSRGSRERRESRMFLVDGQLCWLDDQAAAAAAANSGRSPDGQLPPAGFSPGKRSSSIGLMFGSSVDLSAIGQSMDSSGGAGSANEEAISYRIKWCRESIAQLRRQCWPMEKKLQVLRASKQFIKQHQGELKQSKQARDVLAGSRALAERYWRHCRRELANFLVIITPWEMRIKKIESHFGSVVASYFTFLRWIFWLNLANSLVMCSFVMVPELIENAPDLTGLRKGELGMQQPAEGATQADFNPTLAEMWEFEGFLKFSPIFYGYYSNVELSRSGFWRNPLAFLLSAMLTYLFCFFCISRKLSQNTKLSRIGSKDDEYTFCWTVFVGWDFMIGNSETAYNKTSSLVMNLKEGILEEKEQTKDRDWRLILRRVFANLLTIMLIVASAYVVTLAVQRSENLPEDASLLQKNELQLVMSGIQFMFPPLFDVIGIIEKYHPRKALSWQLGRILFLDFLNFYTLMFSLFGTVDQMGNQLNEVSGNITQLRKNHTYFRGLFSTTTTTTTTTTTPATTTTTTTLATTTAALEAATPMANESVATSWNASIGPAARDQFAQPSSGSTTLLTTILLASSTIMPSNERAGAATDPAALANWSAAGARSPTLLAETATTPVALGGESPPRPSVAYEVVGGDAGEQAAPALTTHAEPNAASPTSARPEPDEDYPDLSVALDGRRRRRRRQADQLERDDEATPAADRRDKLVKQAAGHEAAHRLAAGLPPIQDPYNRNGWPAAPAGLPGNSLAAGGDDDDEEPLEGRLEPSAFQPRPSAGTTPSSGSASPARPKAPGGLARPFGGGAPSRRPAAARGSDAAPAGDDDDDDDDGGDGSETSGAAAALEPEPTTAGQQPAAGSARPAADSRSPLGDRLADEVLVDGSLARQAAGETSTTAASATAGAAAKCPPGADSGGAAVSPAPNANLANGSQPTGPGPPAADEQLAEYLNASVSSFNASEVAYADCVDIPAIRHQEIRALNSTLRDKLKNLCWETMFGQEMVKIVVMDLVMTVVSAVSFEFMRACFVRYCNRFFFWDLERGFPGYQDFKIAENVLHLVNNQSTVWMGMFFAPGLPAINTVKLAVLMYVRSWAVLTCNIPHETVFKVSKSNNFYYWILLINLLICILPVAYAVTWIRPSWHCGPFGGECRMYLVVTKLVKQLLPPEANSVFRYATSPGAVIPILIALVLIIYYLASTVSSSKEANKELKAQLKKDKEQEAAVPEITNTTVADAAAPSEAPPAAGVAAAAAPAPQPAPQVVAEAQPASAPTKPKSLLVPPPI